MKCLIGATASLVLLSAGLSIAAEDPGLEKARQQVQAAMGEDCMMDSDTAEYFDDRVYPLKWMDKSYDPNGVAREGTLYEVFCMAGAYNVMMAYVFAFKDAPPALLAFSNAEFDYAYEDGDDTYTKLTKQPTLTGFSAATTLVNPEFDPETLTLTSFGKWRGLGDAWSSGNWRFDNGRFILTKFTVDPTYEANLDNPTDEQMNRYYTVYDSGD